MKKIEIAYEILSESRRNLNNYAVTKSNFDLIQAHMYSIFECYAHGIIGWRTVEKKFQHSLKEYVNLYKDDTQLMLEEKARMLDEYTRVLEEYKPALDEYKRVHEQKMTSNIVVKQQISESVAQQQSNFYFNKRSLKEADLKDITRLKTWNRVLENYPNLTSKDEQRVRMLTIFEGPTIDTTQLITSIVSEQNPRMSANSIRQDTQQTTSGTLPSRRSEKIGATIGATIGGAVGGLPGRAIGREIGANIGSRSDQRRVAREGEYKKKKADEAAPATSIRPIPRPTNLGNEINIGSVSKSGGTRGIDPRVNYSPADAATLTGQPNTAPAGTPRAPVSSPRPQQRPADLARRVGINRAVSSAMGESAAENYIIANAKSRMADLEPEAREAFLAQLEKSYPGIRQKIGESNETKYRVTAKSLDDNSTFKGGLKSKAAADAEAEKLRKAKSKRGGKSFDNVKVVAEGYKVLPNIDRDRYGERDGLEGPFRTLSGKVVYYDPKEGSYYDPDTDMYLSYDEFQQYDNDYSGMKDERDIDVKEEMSDAEVDAFHRALDAIVHKHIGHGSHEKKKDMNESKIIATGLLRDKPFRKTFKNVEAMRAWADREDADVRGYHAAPGKGEDTQESVNTVGERSMTKGEKSKEERLKKKYDDSEMKRSMKDQYGDRWEEVYYATIRKKAMEQFNEMTSAGAIAAVAQPMGKMQRRKKTNEKKKSPAGGPPCWDGKKIHPTKPTKMKGGKRVNNCIDADSTDGK